MQEPKIINPKKELTHILNYLDKTWDGLDTKSLESLWNNALQDTKNDLDSYGMSKFYNSISAFQEKYENYNKKIKLDDKEISIHNIVTSFILAYNHLCSFERNQRVFRQENITDYIKNVKPKNWDEMYKKYKESGSVEKYATQNNDVKFTGYCCEHSHEGLAYQTRLAHVIYFAQEQETQPEEMLAHAILSHASFVNQHNNKVKMTNELVTAIDDIEKNNFVLDFKEPLNIALKHFMKDKNPSPEIYKIFNINTPKNKAKP